MKEFSSQVCTSVEQSERLLAMGLKPETADMYVTNMSKGGMSYTDDWQIGSISYTDVCRFWKEKGLKIEDTAWEIVPAWSLHRLIELLPQHIHLDYYEDTHYWLVINPLKVIYKNSHGLWIYQCDEGGLYDKLINTIEWTIKNNHFNKEYYYERCKHNNQRN